MNIGNRPCISADDIAMFAPIAIGIACVIYISDALRIRWEHT